MGKAGKRGNNVGKECTITVESAHRKALKEKKITNRREEEIARKTLSP